MQQLEVLVVNLSTSGSRLGGAAIAAQWHSKFMSSKIPLELWRMWDKNEIVNFDGLVVRNFKSRPKFGKIGKILPKLAQKILFESDISQEIIVRKPRIVHLQNPVPGLEFEKIAKICQDAGIKVVVSTHGFQEIFAPAYSFDRSYQKYGWDQWVRQPILRSFPYLDAILIGYPTQKDLLVNNGVPVSKLYLATNGIDPFFNQTPTEEEHIKICQKFNLDLDKPILLFIGNHTPNKGLDRVMQIASNLSTPATVVIGGRLLDKDEPEKWLSSNPPAKDVRVVFTDYLSLLEQRALYHISTLLLFPSLSDTLPLTILEAMGCGLPVVAYDIGGISYQLADNCGVVVPAGDFSALLAATENLLLQPSYLQQISINCMSRQKELFDWEKIATKTVDVYQTI